MQAKRMTEARVAGLAYLLTICAGLFAEVIARSAARSAIDVSGAGLGASEVLYRWGMLADLVMIAAYLAVTVLLYRLLKLASPLGSALAATASGAGLVMLLAGMILQLGPIVDPAGAERALRLHGQLYNVTGFFFGFYCLAIGWLVARSGLAPRWIGALMALAGIAFLADSVLTLVAPHIARQVPDAVMLVSLVGEGALAIWLTVFGGRPIADRSARG
jgi:hypothetical protein